MNKKSIALGILSVALFASCTKGIRKGEEVPSSAILQSGITITNQLPSDDYVPGELVIRFKAGSTETAKAKAFAALSADVKEHILMKAMESRGDKEGIYLLHTSQGTLQAVTNAKAFAEIEYAEPNYIYHHNVTSVSDNYFADGSLWGMYSTKSPSTVTDPINTFGSQANTAWANGHTGSRSVVVGVIDEGINYTHPDLDANIWTNPKEAAGIAGKDDDGNGLVDDIHGYDFVNNDGDVYDAGADSHGTHVSGTIGAENNGTGVVGVNWNVTIISGKFLGPNGGSLTNAVKAINYIVDLKTRHQLNIVALNNSWGGGSYSQSLYDAIENANRAGILFVAAAGNGNMVGIGQNNDKKASYPSGYANTNVIAVAAIDKSGNLASFSNYGATTVDLGAPGVGIVSTVPGSYASYSGTSMATPHVTGACALYTATNSLSPLNAADALAIKNAILSATVPTSSLSKKCVTGGRLNVGGF